MSFNVRCRTANPCEASAAEELARENVVFTEPMVMMPAIPYDIWLNARDRLRRAHRVRLRGSRAAHTEPGDTIAIYGIGGIGINSVQGAALAGARNVVAIDPLANKREAAEQLGATHSAATAEEAAELILGLTNGVGADKAIVTVGVVDSKVVTNAFNVIRKGGTVVVTGLSDPTKNTIELPGAILTLFEKRVQGSLFGSGDPFHDIPRMVELYRSGDLKLDELITQTYTLDQVNEGYQDLIDGKNIRGVIVFDRPSGQDQLRNAGVAGGPPHISGDAQRHGATRRR